MGYGGGGIISGAEEEEDGGAKSLLLLPMLMQCCSLPKSAFAAAVIHNARSFPKKPIESHLVLDAPRGRGGIFERKFFSRSDGINFDFFLRRR